MSAINVKICMALQDVDRSGDASSDSMRRVMACQAWQLRAVHSGTAFFYEAP
jgi:hypothetical protein